MTTDEIVKELARLDQKDLERVRAEALDLLGETVLASLCRDDVLEMWKELQEAKDDHEPVLQLSDNVDQLLREAVSFVEWTVGHGMQEKALDDALAAFEHGVQQDQDRIAREGPDLD